MQELISSPPAFIERKRKILEQLAIPDTEYTDASPKGSVDEGIRDLIDEINQQSGFVTTSSCAGRVSVFLEGRRVADTEGQDERVAGVGGKGAGGAWLFVSHDPVPDKDDGSTDTDWSSLFGLQESTEAQKTTGEVKERRLVHFKYEAMVSRNCAVSNIAEMHHIIQRTSILRYYVDPPRSHSITRTRSTTSALRPSGRVSRVGCPQYHPE
jgi:tRNA wybutosine-synthesizing protein 3